MSGRMFCQGGFDGLDRILAMRAADFEGAPAALRPALGNRRERVGLVGSMINCCVVRHRYELSRIRQRRRIWIRTEV